MPKLSPTVQQLYNWLKQGNVIEQCTSAGRSIGMINTLGTEAPSSLKLALNTLIQYGLLQETETIYLGIRWSRFTVKVDNKSEVLHD